MAKNTVKNVPADKVGDEVQKLITLGAREVTATKLANGKYTIVYDE